MPAGPAIDYSQIFFDERGAPYWRNANGGKVYLPPLTAAQSPDPRAVEWARRMGVELHRDPNDPNTITSVTNDSAPGSSFTRERGHWNSDTGQWDQDINWNNIIDVGVGSFLTAGGLDAFLGGATAAGGGGGAASGTLPSSTIPGLHTAVPGTITSQGVTAGIGTGTIPSATIPGLHNAVPGPIASQGVSNTVPLASSTIPGLHDAVPGPVGGPQGVSGTVPPLGGMGLADGIGSRVRDFFTDPRSLTGLAGLISGFANGNGSGGGGSTPGLEDLARQARITEARMRRVDPLHQAVTQLAFGRMPTSSRNGITLTNVPLPE